MTEQTGRSVVAVEINPAHLKFVEFLPFENRIASVVVEPMDPGQWDDDLYLEEQIRNVVQKHTRAETADFVTSVSASHALFRTVEISDEEEDFHDALRWEMEQYLARPLDEYLMDYHPMGPTVMGTGRAFLTAAYRRSAADRIQAIWEKAGAPLSILDVDAFAVVNAFEANYPALKDGPAFLIKADANATLCIRTRKGMFVGLDVIPLDAQTIGWAGVFPGLVEEIKSSFEAAEASDGKIAQVFLCGDLSLHEKLLDLLKYELSMPVTLLDPFREMRFIEGAEMEDAFSLASQCAGVLGLALRRAGDS